MDLLESIIIICGWLAGTLLLWRIPVCRRKRGSALPLNSISIIIPARDEEKNIGTLLKSIQNQTLRPREVLVIDDNSTDNTQTEALTAGAQVYSSGPHPHGWLGKSWACWQGAHRASGTVLLFLDADCMLEPDGLEKIYSTWMEKGGLVTVEPWHKTERAYEQFSSFFNLIVYAGMNAFTPLQSSIRPAGSFGPCVICSRESYFRAGGHRAVRGKILEDMAIANTFIRSRLPVYCLSGKGAINFRMYPQGFHQLLEGWTKSMATGAADTNTFVRIIITLWISAGLLAAGLLIRVPGADRLQVFAGGCSYAAFVAQMWWMLRRVGNFSFFTALLYPIQIFFFTIIFIRSFVLSNILHKLTWKGREIQTQSPQSREKT
ncbi:MAG: glycosyltransferase family 2 protein [Chitinivibrionales bacterium]